MPIYTRSAFKSAIAGRIHSKSGIMPDIDVTANNAVRDVISKLNLRSMKRKATLAPNLFDDIYQYTCPSDLKGLSIIGLQPQTGERDKFNQWELTSEEEFDRRKQTDSNLLAFSDRDLIRKLLVSAKVNADVRVLAALESLTAEGAWSAFGDGTGLSVDIDEYIKGSGSIKFNISAAGGTTAGIVNSTLPVFDLTNYVSNGSFFVWAWITSATNLTNFKLRVGNNSTNYYEMTATTTNEGAAFTTGWNLLRFDASGKATTGSPLASTFAYSAIYMTKTAGKISENDYRFDNLIVARGKIHNLIYYTNHAWISSTGTYLVDSTADEDYLVCDVEEFDIFVEKFVEHASNEAREYDDRDEAKSNFKEKVKDYRKKYKDESLQLQDTYYNF